MKISRYIIASLALLATLCACRRESVQNPGEKTGRPITWRSNVATKAAAAYSTESLKATSVGVRAYWTDKGKPYGGTTLPYLYLENQQVEFNAGDNLWHCNPAQYWLLGRQMSFFAYAPWTDDEDVFKYESTTSALLRAEFAQNDNPALQTDLLVAKPVLDQVDNNGNPVPLSFKHALSKVLVYLNITGERIDKGVYRRFKLNAMELEGIAGSGKLSYDTTEPGFAWDEIPRSNLAVRNKTYSLSIASGTLEDEYLEHVDDIDPLKTGLDRYLRVQKGIGGELLLLPQPLTGKAKLTLHLTSYKDDGAGNWVEHKENDPKMEIILPAEVSWEAGNVYCYTLTLDVTYRDIIQFGITIVPWGSHSQTVVYP